MRSACIVLAVAIGLAIALMLLLPAKAAAIEIAGDPIMVWYGLAETMVSLLAFTLTVLALSVLPAVRAWMGSRSALAKVLMDDTLAKKMDEGAVNIIRAVEAAMKEKIPGETGFNSSKLTGPAQGLPMTDQLNKVAIVQEAVPILQREFKETLSHFGKGKDQARQYLLARVGKALGDKPGS